MHVVLTLDVGGLENGVVNLINGLDRQRFESHLCCIKHFGALVTRLQPPPAALFEFKHYGGYRPGIIWRLAATMRKQRIDVVHTRNFKSFVFGFIAAKLAGVPVIIHSEHGRDYPFAPWNMRLQKLLSRRTDAVVALSQNLKQSLIRYVGIAGSKLTTICNGVDTSRFTTGDRNAVKIALGLHADDRLVGSVGRLVSVKNHRDLIHAMAPLIKSDNRLKLMLVGDGPERESLRTQARALGIADHVMFTGVRDDIPRLLQAMDVFALTSRNEGISNTLLEAMASGLPVVASDVGGNGEIVAADVAGFLYPAGDVPRLMALIERLLHDSELRATMGRHARQHVLDHYSIDVMIDNYAQLYTRCLAAKLEM